ncbi:MAG: response regulator, partial [Acetatifactor sp.]|nr:response regulator [Acetatifactor sp.]
MRILLVEDDADLNHNLTYYLTQEGYTVDSCFDGEEALYYCKEQQPDLILLDRMLPLLSGTELLKTIRAQGIHVPVLILTAMGTLNDRIEGLD